MTVLTRYIATAYLRMLGLCLGAFITIYLVVDFMEKIGRFARAGASGHHIALFFLTKVPEIISQTAPLAVLMSTLLTLGMLSMSSELIAMRSSGISLFRITAPILIIALVISLLTLVIGELVLPYSYGKRMYIQDVLIAKKNKNTFFRLQNIWFRDENAVMQARLFDPGSNTLKGITLWEVDHALQPARRIDAQQGQLLNSNWVLSGVTTREISETGLVKSTQSDQLAVQLGLKLDDLKVLGKYADNLTIKELLEYCEKLHKGGYDPTRYLAQMHGRISLPFSAVIMAFLGIPFALRSGRSSGIALGIGISLAIGFLYIIINSVLISFGQAGVLPPVIAAWATNFIFMLAGIWLAMTVER